MQGFLTFADDLLNSVSDFLMSDPIIWFVGILLLLSVAKLFKYITN